MNRSRGVSMRAATATVIVISMCFAVQHAAADGVGDQKHKVEQLAAELTSLNERIAVIDEEYGAAQDQKASLDEQIKVSQAKVDAGQAQLGQLQSTLTDLAVSRFTGDNTSDLSPIFASAAVFSAAEQLDALSAIALDSGAGNADDLQSLISTVASDTADLQREQQAATDLIASLEQKKSEGEQLIAEYTKKSADAKAKYGELVQQEADRQAELAAEQAASRAAAKAAKASATPSNSSAAATTPRGGGGSGAAASSAGAAAPATSIPMPPSPSGKAGLAIAAARSMLGTPYVAFEASPEKGFDCSGLTSWAWAQAGVYLPHQSRAQYASNPHVPTDQVQPGDLVFFYSPIHHVGMYIGDGLMIDAPHTGATVRVVGVNWGSVVGVSRPG
jgi:cell wall-associated NlpC family hydrolase